MNKLISFLLSIMICLSLSCSSATKQTSPSLDNVPVFGNKSQIPYSPIINSSVDGVTSIQGAFGVWKVHIDTQTMTAEIVPARNARKIGEIYDADLSQFLTVSPCENCLSITKVAIDDYYMVNVDFRLKHPFTNIAARPDLHGFDVRGILIIAPHPMASTYPAIKVMRPNGTEEDASFTTGILMNPDGYTSHFDELASDQRYFMGGTDVAGNLNPFLRFYDSYTTPAFDPNNPVGQNVMKVGANPYTRTAVFSLGWQGFPYVDMYFVADVAYGQSAVFSNRTSPQYYLPAFHRTEAWRAEYWIENNNLNDSDPNSSADVMVQVFDWQQNATVDPAYPNPSNLSGVKESSKVARVELSVPDYSDNLVTVTVPESGDGSPTNPLTYRLTIKNEKLLGYGSTGLVAIRDELYGAVSPSGRQPIPNSPSGFPYPTSDIRDYSLYQVVTINWPTTKAYRYNNEVYLWDWDSLQDSVGSPVRILPNFFMDPSHTKFQYRWDVNYDGVTFDLDSYGLPPDPEIVYANPGIHNLGLRVRTNSVPPRQYIYTFPVAIDGEYGHTYLSSTVTNDELTSNSPLAIGQTDNNIYIVYSSRIAGQDDIWLAIGTYDGSFTHINLTPSFDQPCKNPSIAVVDNDTYEIVYVAFEVYSEITGWDVYSIFGNLDGSSFDNGNIKVISASFFGRERYPQIIFFWNTVYCYFQAYSTIVSDYEIMAASSPDMGLSWTVAGPVNDVATGYQMHPSVAWFSNISRYMVAWEDYRDDANHGADIYLAKSDYPDMTVFEPAERMSVTNNKTDETDPCLTATKNQMAILYRTTPEGSTDTDLELRINSAYQGTYAVYPLWVDSYGTIQGPATASFIDDTRMAIACLSYNPSSMALSIRARKLTFDPDISRFREDSIYEGVISDIGYTPRPFAISHIIPVGTDSGWVLGSQTIIGWTTYLEGNNVQVYPETSYFGHIDLLGFLTLAP